jgi:hypothetical protein
MIFCKYEFNPEKWEELKTTIQNNNEYVDCAVHEIGNINNSNLYAVDIIWYTDIPEAFNVFEVLPNPVGVHTFLGCEQLYTKRFCEFNPDSPYCTTNETNGNI